MTMQVLFIGNRSATVSLDTNEKYYLQKPWKLTLNQENAGEMQTAVHTIYGLWPDTEYHLEATRDGEKEEVQFHTLCESVTMNVKDFGAAGDGNHLDSPAIQAAIQCCPPDGRVLIPAGTYRILPLFLKDHIRLEIAEGCELKLDTDRNAFPVLPGMLQSTDETKELNFGTWEGNPLDCFAALITGMDVRDVIIYGKGILNGNASKANWWHDPKIRRIAWRGKLVFLCRCQDVVIQGITLKNSPSWNLHPYFSNHLKFLNMVINAPADSPNTDGFDPESCKDLMMAGTHFSVGDDCIAIKSGKIYMGLTYGVPCEDLLISHCLMENGHGGVTIGSEMAGGVHHVSVRNCEMKNTDRGLRIKTRRGRGKNGRIDQIEFENVTMTNVRVPLAVNSMYYCDPDGHSPYVQNREPQEVDERTPSIGRIAMKNVTASGVTCAGYVLGLPEQKVERITLEHVSVSLDKDASPMQPIMADNIPEVSRAGFCMENVQELLMDDVQVSGKEGAIELLKAVDRIERT